MVIKKHFTNYTQNLFKAFIISSKLCLHIVQCYNDNNLVNLIQPSYNSFSTSSKILLNSSINSSPSTLSCTTFTISTMLNIIIMICFYRRCIWPFIMLYNILSMPNQIPIVFIYTILNYIIPNFICIMFDFVLIFKTRTPNFFPIFCLFSS